jgi:hypothetical protein
MKDAGCRMQDAGSRIQDAGFSPLLEERGQGVRWMQDK